jgi:CBS domain containing-hemolysin-like protein
MARPQSEKIQCKNIAEGFVVKANEITLEEIEGELAIEFDEKDKTKTLSDFIFDMNGGYPEEGTKFPFKGFMITIEKLSARNEGIQKVRVQFPTE